MTLQIGYGLITTQRTGAASATWEEVYDDALHLAAWAERVGFDSAWVSEHHLAEDGYLSSVLPFLAALAARTDRITLGTNIAVAPLYQPLRLAEDAAVVATIARRRLILGLGLGYRGAEYAAVGASAADRVPRLETTVEVCRSAWNRPAVSVHSDYGEIHDQPVRPQPAHPVEIWLGGVADPALRRLGRLADGYVAPTTSVDDLRYRLSEADASAAIEGRSVRLGLATNHLVALSETGTMDPAVAAGIRHMMGTYAGWMVDDALAKPLLVERLQRPPQELAVFGRAADVVTQLAPYVAAFAGERELHLMVRLHYPGMGRRAGEEHIERFAEQVMPALRAIAEQA